MIKNNVHHYLFSGKNAHLKHLHFFLFQEHILFTVNYMAYVKKFLLFFSFLRTHFVYCQLHGITFFLTISPPCDYTNLQERIFLIKNIASFIRFGLLLRQVHGSVNYNTDLKLVLQIQNQSARFNSFIEIYFTYHIIFHIQSSFQYISRVYFNVSIETCYHHQSISLYFYDLEKKQCILQPSLLYPSVPTFIPAINTTSLHSVSKDFPRLSYKCNLQYVTFCD